MKKNTLIIFTLILFTACKEEVPRGYFAADGITIGEPVIREPNMVFVPLDFKTDVIHSAQWLYDVGHQVTENIIIITAKISKPPNAPESVYEGGILLVAPEPGEYEIIYEDPDGTKHDIGTITIPGTP